MSGYPGVHLPTHRQSIPLTFFGSADETLGVAGDADDPHEEHAHFNPAVMSFIRDDWIARQMNDRESEYTQFQNMRVFVGTWNVNGKWPGSADPAKAEDITPWLVEAIAPPGTAPTTADFPDIYVVGLQEMVDLTATNVALGGGQAAKRAKDWEELVTQSLNAAVLSADVPDTAADADRARRPPAVSGAASGGGAGLLRAASGRSVSRAAATAGRSVDSVRGPDLYDLIGSQVLVGVWIGVYVKKKHVPFLANVEGTTTAVGLLGMMGNKGAGCVRFRLWDSTFCFVCAHLTAHRENVAGRNADFASIMERTTFAGHTGRYTRVNDWTVDTRVVDAASVAADSVGSASPWDARSSGGVSAHTVVAALATAGGPEDPVAGPGIGVDALVSASAGTAVAAAGLAIGPGGSVSLPASSRPASSSSSLSSASALSGRATDPSTAGLTTAASGLGPLSIGDHEFVVWLGDLNYRIEDDVPLLRCLELATAATPEALEFLRRHDQLNQERRRGNVFQGFEEGPLLFAPTYKYQPGAHVYEQRPDKKLRAPSWCDRVLWRVPRKATSIQLRHYGRCELRTSDHKPVVALFDIAVRTTVEDRRQAVFQSILRELDVMENAAIPTVSLSSTFLDFGDVLYAFPASRVLTVRNTGAVVAPFRFMPKPEERALSPRWLTVDPPFGMLTPGQSCEIEITVNVDISVARDVAMGRMASLDEILILRIERGPDFFISVGARPLFSAFGSSLEQLSRRIEPVRAAAAAALPAALVTTAPGASPPEPAAVTRAKAGMGRGGVLLALPKEVWRLVDALIRPREAVAGGRLAGSASVRGSGGASASAVGGGSSASSASSASSRESGSIIGVTSPPLSIARPTSLPRGIAPVGVRSPSASPTGADDEDGAGSTSGRATRGDNEDEDAVARAISALPGGVFRGIDAHGIFVVPGLASELAIIRESLDTGRKLPDALSPLSLAHALIELLTSLREPVIPVNLFPTKEDFASDTTAVVVSALLPRLPAVHYNTLMYLVALGRELLAPAHAACNQLNAETLARVFSRACMRAVAHDEADAHGPLPGYEYGLVAPGARSAAAAASDPASVGGGRGVRGDKGRPGRLIAGGGGAEAASRTSRAAALGPLPLPPTSSSSSATSPDSFDLDAPGASASGRARFGSPSASGTIAGASWLGAALGASGVTLSARGVADPGTLWEPTDDEQERMTNIFRYLFTSTTLRL